MRRVIHNVVISCIYLQDDFWPRKLNAIVDFLLHFSLNTIHDFASSQVPQTFQKAIYNENSPILSTAKYNQ